MKSREPASASSTAGADWRALSACRETDPELFFPLSPRGPGLVQTARAKVVCGRCEVLDQCLQFALSTGQEFGVWGGTSEDERRRLVRAGHQQLQWQVLRPDSRPAASYQ
jgi:WhiB family redox-sensing transcriptional regulator